MRIAVFGANSYLAQDLIISFSKDSQAQLTLFGRRPAELADWLREQKLEDKYDVLDYSNFSHAQFYDAIINFIGVGNPSQTIKMAETIIEITHFYDQLILDYLYKHPKTKYIFLSSGAAYGGNFDHPATESSVPSGTSPQFRTDDWYGKAKFHAEQKHRQHALFNIIDLRVFNYFSRTLDLTTDYFISVVLRSIFNKEILSTTNQDMIRDYLHPNDFYQIIRCVLAIKESLNRAFDCYSRAIISKMAILKLMQKEFSLRYHFTDTHNQSISKPNYYSLNHNAAAIHYQPSLTSEECLLTESRYVMTYNTNLY